MTLLREVRACRERRSGETVHDTKFEGPVWAISKLTALLPRIDAALAKPVDAPADVVERVTRALEELVVWLEEDSDNLSLIPKELVDRLRATLTAKPVDAPADVVERVAVAIRNVQGCGLTIEGEHVFCDDPRAGEHRLVCDCYATARAALAALRARHDREGKLNADNR